MEEEPIKKSKKGLVWLILAIIIIAILVGGFCYYKSSTKPVNIFTKQIDAVIDSLGNQEEYDTENVTVALSGNIETEDEDIKEVAEYVNKSKITLNAQVDYKAKTEVVNLGLNYDNDDLLKLKAYYAEGDNNIYLYVDELFDKYFKVNLDETEDSEEIFSQETLTLGQKLTASKVAKILKQEIKEQLKEEYFSQEKVDDTTKSTMKLTVKQLKEMVITICNNLQNNEEFLDCFEDKDEIKESLADIVTSLQEETEYDNYNLEIAIYTKGMFANDTTKVDITIIDDTNSKVTVNVNKIDDENYEFNIQAEDVDALKGTIKIEKIDDNSEKYIVAMEIPDVGNVTVNLEVSTETNKEIEKVDVSNSVDINNLSEEDEEKMFTNLQNMKIYELLAPLLFSSSMLY